MARNPRKGEEKIARFQDGRRYENKVYEFRLEPLLSPLGNLQREPCFRFSNGHRSRFCFPDALLVLNSGGVIIEIKTRHTYDAWYQLTELYHPVVQKALGGDFKFLEVVREYDPGVRLPVEKNVLNTVTEIVKSDAPYNVYIWSGR